MNDILKGTIEAAAFKALKKNNPGLLEILKKFTVRGYDTERILEICAAASGATPDRLAMIGCAADYLINNPEPVTPTIQ